MTLNLDPSRTPSVTRDSWGFYNAPAKPTMSVADFTNPLEVDARLRLGNYCGVGLSMEEARLLNLSRKLIEKREDQGRSETTVVIDCVVGGVQAKVIVFASVAEAFRQKE